MVDIVILLLIMNLSAVVDYVLKMLDELPKQYLYHNLAHTRNVYDMTLFYSKAANLSKTNSDLACTAAIMHDLGYIIQYSDNEPLAVTIAQEILPRFGYTDNHIKVVADCIMATSIPQKAQTLLQMIVCDADLDYLGRDDYFEIAENLRKEWLTQGKELSLEDWRKMQVDFLSNHSYYTEEAQKKRGTQKIENLHKLLIHQ